MSLALDRKALVERALSGQGAATMQLVPEGFGGWDPAVTVPAVVDRRGPHALLAEAGISQRLRHDVGMSERSLGVRRTGLSGGGANAVARRVLDESRIRCRAACFSLGRAPGRTNGR